MEAVGHPLGRGQARQWLRVHAGRVVDAQLAAVRHLVMDKAQQVAVVLAGTLRQVVVPGAAAGSKSGASRQQSLGSCLWCMASLHVMCPVVMPAASTALV